MKMEREEPTREYRDSAHEDYQETHPAYAMIGASRVSSGKGEALAGSDFLHQHYMTVTIRNALLSRGLSHDYWLAADEYIEVALSEAQWATFVSTPNMGHGTPCTLQWKDGYVPRIEPITDRREQFNDEVQRTLADAVKALDDVLATSNLTKASREKVEKARQEIRSNLPFVMEQADEHIEKTIEKAKSEVEAYLANAIQRAGLEALGASRPITLIESGDVEVQS